MAGNLVNAFGKIALEDTQTDNRDLLLKIIAQLQIMNLHLSVLTDTKIEEFDLITKEEY